MVIEAGVAINELRQMIMLKWAACPGPPGAVKRLCFFTVNRVCYGALAWACGVLVSKTWRCPARADITSMWNLLDLLSCSTLLSAGVLHFMFEGAEGHKADGSSSSDGGSRSPWLEWRRSRFHAALFVLYEESQMIYSATGAHENDFPAHD
jgi:hypothetical protein